MVASLIWDCLGVIVIARVIGAGEGQNGADLKHDGGSDDAGTARYWVVSRGGGGQAYQL